MIYGSPQYTIDDDQTDKVGVRTVMLSLMWQPTRVGLSPLEVLAAAPEPPPMPGGVQMVGSQTRRHGGALRTSWTFRGINGDGRGVTFKQRHNTTDYGFQPGFAQVSIQLHKRFTELRDEYGGFVVDGEVNWPPTIAVGTAGHGLAKKGTEKTNPMFGVQDFLRAEGTYYCRYLAVSLSGLHAGVEEIHTSGALPGEAPHFPDRDWLKAQPAYERCGPVYEITETYWLSGRGGWPKPVYGTTKSSGGGGLPSGTFQTF